MVLGAPAGRVEAGRNGMQPLRGRAVDLAVVFELAARKQQRMRAAGGVEDRPLEGDARAVARGQAVERRVPARAGGEARIAGVVEVEAGHFVEAYHALERAAAQGLRHAGHEGAVAAVIGEALGAAQADGDAGGLLALPGAGEDADLVAAVAQPLRDPEAVPLQAAMGEPVEDEEGEAQGRHACGWDTHSISVVRRRPRPSPLCGWALAPAGGA
jgi:hypothetical protein